MKLSAILWISAVVAATQAQAPTAWCSGPYLREVVRKCTAQHATTQADVDDYVYIRPAASEKAKCFRACLFAVCQAFNVDGTLVANVPQTFAFLTSRRDPTVWPIAEQAATYCVNTIPIGHNICDTTENFLQCVRAKTPPEFSFEGAL